jgi:hypothetical protein
MTGEKRLDVLLQKRIKYMVADKEMKRINTHKKEKSKRKEVWEAQILLPCMSTVKYRCVWCRLQGGAKLLCKVRE